MKITIAFFTLLILLTSNTHALQERSFLSIELSDDQIISGELLEKYEDRWFYESIEDQKSYLLLFTDEIDPFVLISVNDIKETIDLGIKTTTYDQFLLDNDLLIKAHPIKEAHVITGNTGHHKFEKMFGNFAWDLGIVNDDDHLFKNEGKDKEDYFVFNEPVYSPFNGVVIGIVKDQPDNDVDLTLSSDLSDKINNYLTIQIHENVFLSLVHFKFNTLKVELGETIQKGDYLGRVGNSGVSYLPHLHYTLYTYIESIDRFISIPALGLK